MSPVTRRVAALMLSASPVCAANSRLPRVKLTPPGLNTFFDGTGSAPAGPLTPPGLPPTAPGGLLPKTAVPLRYDLHLTLDPEAGAFAGRARILVQAEKPFASLTLNALDLSVVRASVGGRAAAASVDAAAETLTLSWDGPVQGEAVVEVEYSGRMSSMMRGVYQTAGKDGKKLAFSHLEPTHARRVLPSFDEPAFKAPFALTLTAPQGLTLLSNMPAEETKTENGWTTARFGETPRMSSYLLSVTAAFLVPTRRGRITAWTTPADVPQTAFALEIAEEALPLLEDYFQEPYGLPKLDLITAPNFASGAMENWGAVLFRDAALLVDPALTSAKGRRRVADVVTHELVHQWFGNLVTMKWWDDLWLNEAFATWLAAKMVDKMRPRWKAWLDFEHGRRAALDLDALRGTRPVRSQASTPAEIQALFDPLTYQKGGAILRMLESWLGEKRFRDGLRSYMRKHRYGNAAASDLWAELGVGAVAEGWLTQPGYPIVTAGVKGRSVTLSQRRFTADGLPGQGLWSAPVVLRYKLKGEKRSRIKRVLLTEASMTVELPGSVEWAYPNAGAVGFFRAESRAPLSELPEVERAAALQDLWAAVQAGSRPLDDLVEALKSLKDDRSPLILEDVAGLLQALSTTVVREEDRPAFKKLARSLLAPHASRLGWKAKKGESEAVSLARAAVQAAYAELVDGSEAASKLGSELDPLLVPASLGAAARAGDSALFEELRRRMAAAGTPELRDQLLRALCKFRGTVEIDRVLEMTLTDEIKAQDAWKVLVWMFADPGAQEQAWAFTRQRWAELLAKLGPRGANRIIAAAGSLRSPLSVRRFFEAPENRVELARKSLEQAVESAAMSERLRRGQGRWLK